MPVYTIFSSHKFNLAMKHTFFSMICLTIALIFAPECLAQTKEAEAQAEYKLAEEYYAEGKYDLCLYHVKEAERILGNSNPRILYLKAKAYDGKGDMARLHVTVKDFFDVTEEGKPTQEIYQEMLTYKIQLRKEESERRAKDDNAYQEAISSIDVEKLHNYLQKFPSGRHRAEVEEKIGEMEDSFFKSIEENPSIKGLDMYKEIYSSGKHLSKLPEMYCQAHLEMAQSREKIGTSNSLSEAKTHYQKAMECESTKGMALFSIKRVDKSLSKVSQISRFSGKHNEYGEPEALKQHFFTISPGIGTFHCGLVGIQAGYKYYGPEREKGLEVYGSLGFLDVGDDGVMYGAGFKWNYWKDFYLGGHVGKYGLESSYYYGKDPLHGIFFTGGYDWYFTKIFGFTFGFGAGYGFEQEAALLAYDFGLKFRI